MNAKRWIALGIAGLLLIISVGFQVVANVAATNFEGLLPSANEDGIEEQVMEEGSGAEKIAVLNLEGVIQDTGDTSGFMSSGSYNHRQFLQMLKRSGERSDIGGIILRVNTPGGGVVESAEIHDAIQTIKEETEKPVYISMGNTAASGGYYVSTPADRIVAHPATITGSIGVIMESVNYAELAEELGLEFNTIKSGEFKDIMSGSRDMTEEDEEILQSIVDEMYGDFVNVIAEGRDMSEENVRDIGDGRVYTGTQAQEIDLVDDLGSIEDTIAFMKKDEDLGDAPVVQYNASFSFNQFLGTSAKSLIVKDSELLGLKELLMESDSPRAMYLYRD
ncbi:signal peptide peptidase SppA [Alteribacillus sp. HJP-4]|uniref:signal peptide peptidase SppA n=1 Tax=Alteribacillus sp. HJP-4 TaxID=2775394 RepID=UPI0035CCD59F